MSNDDELSEDEKIIDFFLLCNIEDFKKKYTDRKQLSEEKLVFKLFDIYKKGTSNNFLEEKVKFSLEKYIDTIDKAIYLIRVFNLWQLEHLELIFDTKKFCIYDIVQKYIDTNFKWFTSNIYNLMVSKYKLDPNRQYNILYYDYEKTNLMTQAIMHNNLDLVMSLIDDKVDYYRSLPIHERGISKEIRDYLIKKESERTKNMNYFIQNNCDSR